MVECAGCSFCGCRVTIVSVYVSLLVRGLAVLLRCLVACFAGPPLTARSAAARFSSRLGALHAAQRTGYVCWFVFPTVLPSPSYNPTKAPRADGLAPCWHGCMSFDRPRFHSVLLRSIISQRRSSSAEEPPHVVGSNVIFNPVIAAAPFWGKMTWN